jgi:hypothetical protein
MTRSQGRHRRRILLAAVALLAGCAGGRSDGDDSDGTITTTTTDTTSPARTDDGGPESTPSTPSSSSTAATGSAGATSRSETTDAVTGTASSPAGGLDLREANVTAVTVSEIGDDVRFDVTLHHDDDGEDGYANWWQVETRTGERLGRRDLLHAHGTREFTRSATVTVPSEVACVVVRGHDQTHGYGGRAMLVDPRSGATRAVDQGPAPAQMADELCP